MTVDSKTDRVQAEDIRKRTPSEQAIAERTNRRAISERRKRERGLLKATAWVPVEANPLLKRIVALLNEGPADREALERFVSLREL